MALDGRTGKWFLATILMQSLNAVFSRLRPHPRKASRILAKHIRHPQMGAGKDRFGNVDLQNENMRESSQNKEPYSPTHLPEPSLPTVLFSQSEKANF